MASPAPSPSFLNLLEVEPLAKQVLPKMVYDYYSGGSETMSTVKENQEVFTRIKLVPRILRNVANVQTAPKPLWGERHLPLCSLIYHMPWLRRRNASYSP